MLAYHCAQAGIFGSAINSLKLTPTPGNMTERWILLIEPFVKSSTPESCGGRLRLSAQKGTS